jgi:hypothetical protein
LPLLNMLGVIPVRMHKSGVRGASLVLLKVTVGNHRTSEESVLRMKKMAAARA